MALFVGTNASEMIDGGDGNDEILGLGGSDEIVGGSGTDRVYGGTGDDLILEGADSDAGDTLFGEAGNDRIVTSDIGGDTIHGGFGADAYEIDDGPLGGRLTRIDLLNQALNNGFAAGDRLTSIEIFRGGSFADRIFGSGANELFLFSPGDNLYNGRGGRDVYVAELPIPPIGNTTITFEIAYGARASQIAADRGLTLSSAQSGVAHYTIWIDDNGNQIRDPDEETFQTDELIAIEEYVGIGVDTFVGSAADEVFHLIGSGSVKGAAGFDFISYSERGSSGPTGVIVDLNAGSAQALAGATSLLGIEGAIGSIHGDSILGTSTVNTFVGAAGQDFLDGRGGNDRLDGGADIDLLLGSGGNDVLNGDSGADTLDGGDGTDTASYAWTLSAVNVNLATGVATGAAEGDGDSLIAVENVIGTAFADQIRGDALANRLEGRSGSDTIHGGGGNDRIYADSGSGTPLPLSTTTFDPTAVIGDAPIVEADDPSDFDSLFGQSGDDTLIADSDSGGTLRGGAGNDRLEGGGDDSLQGGRGNDTYVSDGANITERAGEGIDQVLSSASLFLPNHIENLTLTGSAAIDGDGNGLDNEITGNGAANELTGADGDDVLSGGLGADTLDGGAGTDTLRGGNGRDTFRFDNDLQDPPNVDAILDFVSADDTILLDREIFAALPADGPLAAAFFRVGTAAADANDRIIYDKPTGRIFYDADGNGTGAAAVLFVTVTPGTTLTAADFVAFPSN